MSKEKSIQKLEKEIFIKMMSIKNNTLTPKDSGIGKLFTILRNVDPVSYEKNIEDYKKILKQNTK